MHTDLTLYTTYVRAHRTTYLEPEWRNAITRHRVTSDCIVVTLVGIDYSILFDDHPHCLRLIERACRSAMSVDDDVVGAR